MYFSYSFPPIKKGSYLCNKLLKLLYSCFNFRFTSQFTSVHVNRYVNQPFRQRKKSHIYCNSLILNRRGTRIRTWDPLLPKRWNKACILLISNILTKSHTISNRYLKVSSFSQPFLYMFFYSEGVDLSSN